MNEEVRKQPAVSFRGKEYTLEFSQYTANDNTAMRLVDSFGTPQLTVTVNFEPLPPHLVYIKDWSENHGIAHAMRRLITPTGEYRKAGHVRAQQYELGEELLAFLDLPRHAVELNPDDEEDIGLRPGVTSESMDDAAVHDAQAHGEGEGSPDDEATDPVDMPPAA